MAVPDSDWGGVYNRSTGLGPTPLPLQAVPNLNLPGVNQVEDGVREGEESSGFGSRCLTLVAQEASMSQC